MKAVFGVNFVELEFSCISIFKRKEKQLVKIDDVSRISNQVVILP